MRPRPRPRPMAFYLELLEADNTAELVGPSYLDLLLLEPEQAPEAGQAVVAATLRDATAPD